MVRNRIIASLVMACSVAGVYFGWKIAPDARLTPGLILSKVTVSIAIATFMTAWLAGWFQEGILGNKWRSIAEIFLLFCSGFVLFLLVPPIIANMLGKDQHWQADFQESASFVCLLLTTGWTLFKERKASRI